MLQVRRVDPYGPCLTGRFMSSSVSHVADLRKQVLPHRTNKGHRGKGDGQAVLGKNVSL